MVARDGTERDNQAFLYLSRRDAKPAFGIRFFKELCRSLDLVMFVHLRVNQQSRMYVSFLHPRCDSEPRR
jgi:hypothetical protein